MTKKNDCKMRECLSTHRREIVGAFFLVLATLLTALTFSGMGMLGMFIAGVALCCKRNGCCNCHCHSSAENCCDVDTNGKTKLPNKNNTKTTKA